MAEPDEAPPEAAWRRAVPGITGALRRRAAVADRARHPLLVTVLICGFSLLLTALATLAAVRADHSAERTLLQGQTRQAAAVVSTAILLIQQPLRTTLAVQHASGPHSAAATFTRQMAGLVGPTKLFADASLWQRGEGGSLHRVARVGLRSIAAPGAVRSYLHRALGSTTFTVRAVTSGSRTRVGYALGDPATGTVVYAERLIAADRRAPVDTDSAFADLHYATYLGRKIANSALQTTDVDPGTLPLSGNTSRAVIPFGNTVITLVAEPRHPLGAGLSHRLPLWLLLSGLVLTVLIARTGHQLSRGRQVAESDAATIADLLGTVETLYGQQRELSVRLQRALLPYSMPAIPGLELASEYVAGAHGIDIGGDWYSIIPVSADRFAFVVGDVSGRGVDSVAVMAHARFTLRAYLIDGSSPAKALEKCSHQFDILRDGHITTAVVGIGNRRTGKVTLANAGHPAPLLLDATGAHNVPTTAGPPLGSGPATYPETTFTIPRGATLFCFTDGLIERRGEAIDVGMSRLAATIQDVADQPLADLINHAVTTLRNDDAPDDIAVLAMRREARR
ncbi:MAG TPA: PP2C family protein-serine/threonine phosphatase [Marmoricola sp.]|nr:PP2C family protein-serine/threonine phosphatase [Marmoricola sp.]